jgi:hypothetical protein
MHHFVMERIQSGVIHIVSCTSENQVNHDQGIGLGCPQLVLAWCLGALKIRLGEDQAGL